MAKLCECCGNRNNLFSGDPLYLEGDKILCYKCAKPIRNELNLLYYAKTKEEVDSLSTSIIGKSKALFDDRITNQIVRLVKERCEKLDIPLSNSDIDGIAPITENSAPNTHRHGQTSLSPATGVSSAASGSTGAETFGMFDNIGGKIKMLAQVITWIGIIASIVLGAIIIANDEDMVLWGLVIMIFGSLGSWISSFVLYGFGQLIENSDKLVKLLKK